jgi:hypothetical protein
MVMMEQFIAPHGLFKESADDASVSGRSKEPEQRWKGER